MLQEGTQRGSYYDHLFPLLNFLGGETEAEVHTARKMPGPGSGPMSVPGQNSSSSPVCTDVEPRVPQ